MARKFDSIIIGGGNAGFGASAVLSAAGQSLAFIEKLDFGGTCPNRGCTPKKILVAASHALQEIADAPTHGITVENTRLDWKKLMARKQEMIGFIPGAMAETAASRGTVFNGNARFVAEDRIEVAGEELEASNFIIATGSRPRRLPIPGAQHLLTSDDILSNEELPADALFIGGGVIALELGHVYARAGVKVTILEAMPQLLPRLDGDAVAVLRKATEDLGITVHSGVSVHEIVKAGSRLRVHFEHDGRQQMLEADQAINGAGREADVEGLDLTAGGIRHNGSAIDVDDFLRSTSNLRVWVAGDALTRSAQLSPLATHEGRVVGHNILNGPERKPDYNAVPSAVYTLPSLSSVGLSERDAIAAGLRFEAKVSDMSGWFSARTHVETAAWAKLLVEEGSDRIIGAHMVGHHGEELIHLFSLAMRHGITASELKDSPFAFPTFASDIKNIL